MTSFVIGSILVSGSKSCATACNDALLEAFAGSSVASSTIRTSATSRS